MKTFLEFINEAKVQIDVSRYVRSHGKKPSNIRGGWVFTSKASGDVDYENKKITFDVKSEYKDAVKQAKDWATKQGHSTIYLMESKIISEEKSDLTIKDFDLVVIEKETNKLIKTLIKVDPKIKMKTGSGREIIDFTSPDFASINKPFMFKKISIGVSSSNIFKENGVDILAIAVGFEYEHFDGGTNGSKIATMFFDINGKLITKRTVYK